MVEVVPLKYADVSEVVGILLPGAGQGVAPNDNFFVQNANLGSTTSFGGGISGTLLGGGVALQVAIRHPEVVRKLVVVSAAYKRQGMYPEVLATMEQMGPGAGEMMKQSPLSKMYPEVNWATLFTKLSALLSKDYDWSKDVPTIKAPTLLVLGDADAVRTAHAVQFFELLGGGKRDGGWDGSGVSNARLAILPGVTH